MLEGATWADAILLAGDFGRNSETAIVLDNLAAKYNSPLTISQDGNDYFLNPKSPILTREDSLLIVNMGKLQKLAKHNRPARTIRHAMTLLELVNVLSEWTKHDSVSVITKHADNLIVACGGRVSTTTEKADSNWQTELAAYVAVWWLQQPTKKFEALTTAVVDYSKLS
jgi:protein associated with RNAse G/E